MKKRVDSWLCVSIYIIGIVGTVMISCDGSERRKVEGRRAMCTPLLGKQGMDCPVAEVASPAGQVSLFRFHEGRLVGGYSTDYGVLTIDVRPLEMEVEERTAGSVRMASGHAVYRHIRMTQEGYVTAMSFRQRHTTAAGTGYVRSGYVHASYTSDGQISRLQYVYDDSRGFRAKNSMKYSWKDGDLQYVVSDFFHSDDLYEKHYMISFVYSEPDTLLPNSGIYWEQMMPPSGVLHDFMWYGGMLGKPTAHVPVRVRRETVGDGTHHSEQWDIRTERDDHGRVCAVYYGDRLYRRYAYDRTGCPDDTAEDGSGGAE